MSTALPRRRQTIIPDSLSAMISQPIDVSLVHTTPPPRRPQVLTNPPPVRGRRKTTPPIVFEPIDDHAEMEAKLSAPLELSPARRGLDVDRLLPVAMGFAVLMGVMATGAVAMLVLTGPVEVEHQQALGTVSVEITGSPRSPQR